MKVAFKWLVVVVICLAFITGFTFTGCSKETKSNEDTTEEVNVEESNQEEMNTEEEVGAQEEVSETEKVVVQFANFHSAEEQTREVFDYLISSFEADNPDIEIENMPLPYEQTQQQTLIAASAGNAPDIIELVPMWVPVLAEIGALADLTEYYTADELSDIPSGSLNGGKIGDSLYSIPLVINPVVVYTSKALLEQAGLPVEVPDTWDDFKVAIKRISELGEDIYGFGARVDKSVNSAYWMFAPLWGFGGNFEDENGQIVLGDTDGFVKTLDWYQELALEEQIPLGVGVRDIRNVFAQNANLGFTLDVSGALIVYQDLSGKGVDYNNDIILGLVPKAADGNRYNIGNDNVFGVAAQSEVKEEAVRFIKYMTQDPETVKYLYDSFGWVPTYRSMIENDPYYSDQELLKTTIEAADIANTNPSKNPKFINALDFIAVAMQKAILGDDTTKAAEEAVSSIKILYGQ